MSTDPRTALLRQLAADLDSADPGELADRYRAAVTAVLDLAERMETGVSGPSQIGLAFAEQIRVTIAEQIVRPKPSTPARQPRRWLAGSDEPRENGLVVRSPANGVRFRYRAAWGRWVALPPEGDDREYTWAEMNRGVDIDSTTFVEELAASGDRPVCPCVTDDTHVHPGDDTGSVSR